MNTCKDCKWWDKSELFCGNPVMEFNGMLFRPEPIDGIRIGQLSVSEYVVQFGPDFGCIHWEKKDE